VKDVNEELAKIRNLIGELALLVTPKDGGVPSLHDLREAYEVCDGLLEGLYWAGQRASGRNV
jgi:hypothetical protein